MKKIFLGALATLSLSSVSLAADYVCESDKVEVRAAAMENSALYQLEVVEKGSQETIYQDVAEALLGSGVDATFNVPGQAILVIDAAGYGELTFQDSSYYGLDCRID